MKVLFFENVSLTLRVRNRPMSVLYSPIASDVERSRNIKSLRDTDHTPITGLNGRTLNS